MTLHNLADTILPSERFPEAEALLRQALIIKERAYGPKHPAVAETLVVLGALYAARNEYALAESTLDRALAIWAVTPPNDPLPEAEALANLALVKQTQGRFAEAAPLYEQAITRFEAGAGSRHPNALRARYNAAATYAAMGNYSVAIRRYEEMLASEEAAYGPDDPGARAAADRARHGEPRDGSLRQGRAAVSARDRPAREDRSARDARPGLRDRGPRGLLRLAEAVRRGGAAVPARHRAAREPGEDEPARARRDDRATSARFSRRRDATPTRARSTAARSTSSPRPTARSTR